ncbi:MAG: diguanylate cyclase domain-containing protein [Silanimonas lenta]
MAGLRAFFRVPRRASGLPWRELAAVLRQPALWLPVAGVAMVAALLLEAAVRADRQRASLQYAAMLRTEAELIRSRIEGRVAHAVAPVEGIALLVGAGRLPDAATLDALAAGLAAREPLFRSLAVAPDLVIRSVHPYRGNEAALGIDFRADPAGQEAVRAYEEGRLVLAGPFPLRQGGVGLSARVPYREAAGGSGLLSITLDFEALLQASGLLAFAETRRFALRPRLAEGSVGAVFLGDPELPPDHSLMLDIRLPGASWEWRIDTAQPATGTAPPSLRYGLPAAVMLVLLVAALAFTRAWYAHLARHDPLSGLPNRRALFERLEQRVARREALAGKCCLMALDLDGFKAVNDRHGHREGDRVIEAVGHYLRSLGEAGLWAARRSGDEFVLLACGRVPGDPGLQAVVAGLPAALRRLLGSDFGVSASAGEALLDAGDATADQWLKRADDALYEAKRRRAR